MKKDGLTKKERKKRTITESLFCLNDVIIHTDDLPLRKRRWDMVSNVFFSFISVHLFQLCDSGE